MLLFLTISKEKWAPAGSDSNSSYNTHLKIVRLMGLQNTYFLPLKCRLTKVTSSDVEISLTQDESYLKILKLSFYAYED